jgi:hypothetical protein
MAPVPQDERGSTGVRLKRLRRAAIVFGVLFFLGAMVSVLWFVKRSGGLGYVGPDPLNHDPVGFGASAVESDYSYPDPLGRKIKALPRCRASGAFIEALEGALDGLLQQEPYKARWLKREVWFENGPAQVDALQVRYAMSIPEVRPDEAPLRYYQAVVVATADPSGTGFAIYSNGLAFRGNQLLTLADTVGATKSDWYRQWIAQCYEDAL